jgi:hypothetical protein
MRQRASELPSRSTRTIKKQILIEHMWYNHAIQNEWSHRQPRSRGWYAMAYGANLTIPQKAETN